MFDNWRPGLILAYKAPDQSPQCGILIYVSTDPNDAQARVFGRASETGPPEFLSETPARNFHTAEPGDCDPDALDDLLEAWANLPILPSADY